MQCQVTDLAASCFRLLPSGFIVSLRRVDFTCKSSIPSHVISAFLITWGICPSLDRYPESPIQTLFDWLKAESPTFLAPAGLLEEQCRQGIGSARTSTNARLLFPNGKYSISHLRIDSLMLM